MGRSGSQVDEREAARFLDRAQREAGLQRAHTGQSAQSVQHDGRIVVQRRRDDFEQEIELARIMDSIAPANDS